MSLDTLQLWPGSSPTGFVSFIFHKFTTPSLSHDTRQAASGDRDIPACREGGVDRGGAVVEEAERRGFGGLVYFTS